MYARCPEQYRRAYIEGEREPPGIALIVGSSVHDAAEDDLRSKAETGELMADDDVRDRARDSVMERTEEGFDPGETSAEVARAEAVDVAVDAASEFHRVIAPEVSPLITPDGEAVIEHGWSIEIDDPDVPKIIGFIDYAHLADDGGVHVRDLKTAGKKPSQSQVDSNLQLTAYSLGAELALGQRPDSVGIDALVKRKSGAEAVRITSTRTDADHDAFLRRVVAVSRSIQAGAFPPTDPGQWHCSERFCGFWKSCPYVGNG